MAQNNQQTARENVATPGSGTQPQRVTSPEQGPKILRRTLAQHGVDEVDFWNSFLPIITGFVEGSITESQATQRLATMLQTTASGSMRP